MDYKWLNDEQPDDNGDYVAIIENAAGERTSTFKGKTYKEVADKLLQSQVMANRQLVRLKKPDQGRTALKVEPEQLTPDDRFRLATAITDPSKVVEAVTEIVTAEGGIAPKEIGGKISQDEQNQTNAYYAAEADAFRKEHPAYYPVAQNRDALFDELKANGWDLTRNNLAIAYQTLMDRDELIPWPEGESEAPPNGNPGNGSAPANGYTAAPPAQPAARPRSIATGIRSSDASAQRPTQPTKKQYTRADIERMSRVEYTQRLQTDPDFRRQVDAMGA